MDNVEIARALNEMADLLDIQGANPFRVRAYRNAVRTITNLTRPLSEMVEDGADLEELPGVGHDIAAYITELCKTGRLEQVEELEQLVPPSLALLLRLEGVGPRRAKLLHDELKIETVEALADAVAAGKVEALRGFGAKMAERIARAIQDLEKHTGRFLLSDADQVVRPLLDYMRRAQAIQRVEPAGSYRRRLETVGDVDLLAISPKPAAAMEHFTSYPDVARVEAAGRTRGAVMLKSGLHVDLRILPKQSYGAALHYFTGSKPHNIAVRRLGVDRGLRISEYGVFRVGRRAAAKTAKAAKPAKGGRGRKATKSTAKPRRIGGTDEQDVFRAVGMAWVPPELRENRGEIEAALAGKLPKLITEKSIRGDLQMHSDWTDGHDTIEEMAEAARAREYEYIAITDHSKAVTVAGGLTTRRFRAQSKEIARVQRRVPSIRILRGAEIDILRDGTLDAPDELLYELDVVVASVHSYMKLSKTQMTERLLRAIAHPAVHILGHPTGRLINKREPYEIDVEAVLGAAAEHGVAIELNAQPDRLDLNDVYVRRAKEMGVTIAINTDAHSTEELGWRRFGVDHARRAWLEPPDVLNALRLGQLEKWLRRRRTAASPQAARPRKRAATKSGVKRKPARPRTRAQRAPRRRGARRRAAG